MQIVIDIPDSLYENILICWENIHPKVWKILKNGTPLPKGHGELIDRSKIYLTGFELLMCDGDLKEVIEALVWKIENAPTIIEADKEVENDS